MIDLRLGDCLEVMRDLEDSSIDAIVTDPPYGLTTNKKGGSGVASVNLNNPYGRSRIGTGKAAVLEGFRFIGIERDPAYLEIAKARIVADAKQLPLLVA